MSFSHKLITLISSHLIEELRNVTDKFLFIHQGKVAENKILSFRQLKSLKAFREYSQ